MDNSLQNPLMRIPIALKLFGLLALVGLAASALMAWRMSSEMARGFNDYVARAEWARLDTLATALSNYFAQKQSWADFDQQAWRQLQHEHNPNIKELNKAGMDIPPPPPHPPAHTGPPPTKKGPNQGPRQSLTDPLNFIPRTFLLDASGEPIIGRRPPPAEFFQRAGRTSQAWEQREIKHQGEVVAVLGLMPLQLHTTGREADYLRSQQTLILSTTLWVMLGVVVLSALLAYFLVRRLKAIEQVARQVAEGDFMVRNHETRLTHDELSALADAVDEMAHKLESHAQLRRQWFGQIAHELRTPLAILRGEIEALIDGVRVASPYTLESLAQEVMHLTRLTDDMQLLANSALGNVRVVNEEADLAPLLEQALERWQERYTDRCLTLTLTLPKTTLLCQHDHTRMQQVVDNLLANSLCYTDAPGHCRLALSLSDDARYRACLTIEDSAPGIKHEEHDHLFDAMWRGQTASTSEGSGLGLAVCKALVEAQGGQITSMNSTLGGLRMEILLK